MGITCKPWGEFGKLMKKVDNELKAKEEALKHRETKPKKTDKSTRTKEN